MKKNKMMRTAAALGVATLLTTCALSGTLAKYTTTAEAQDSARVAKWGVTITMEDDDSAFKSVYKKDDTNDYGSITNTVTASNRADSTDSTDGDKVVAPGTTGETTFTVKGTPEVAFKLDIKVDSTSTIKVDANTDCTLVAGTFEDTEVKVKPSVVYEPIVFTLQKATDNNLNNYTIVDKKQQQNESNSAAKAENMTLAELKTELEALSTSYEPNKEVNDTYKIVWSWPFETNFSSYNSAEGYKTYENGNVLDTYLGNQTAQDVQYETYKITITATQID